MMLPPNPAPSVPPSVDVGHHAACQARGQSFMYFAPSHFSSIYSPSASSSWYTSGLLAYRGSRSSSATKSRSCTSTVPSSPRGARGCEGVAAFAPVATSANH